MRSSGAAATSSSSGISGRNSVRPRRITAAAPLGASGSGGYSRCSVRASSTLSGSMCATPTLMISAPSSTDTVHQSAMCGTASSASRCSVCS